ASPGTPAALAAVARESGDPARLADALAATELALAERPSDTDMRLLQAGLLAQLGRRSGAEAALRVVLDARPDSAPAANDLACILLDRKNEGPEPEAIRADLIRVDLAEAEQLSRRAIAIAPMAAAFHDTLARILARTGRSDEARRSFETAIQLDPTLAAARNGLSQLDSQRAMTE
ncbi:MAG: hypothetical protein JWM57_202, partial [Phycisphaerales bacterium]|nr:hypothetical protein [Phycisphaerales bacterium]